MCYPIKKKICCLLIFLSFFVVNAQDDLDESAFLVVSVWSNDFGFLKNLKIEDFEIYERKKVHRITSFKQEDEPMSIGVLFDLSESVGNPGGKKFSEIPFATKGLSLFISKSNVGNEYFFMGFNQNFDVLLDYTQNIKKIEESLTNISNIKPTGNTSFYDALNAAFEKVLTGRQRKKVLILITDGDENDSRKYGFNYLEKLTEQQNILLYAVNILTRKDDITALGAMEGQARLEELTAKTGGRVFNPRSPDEVNKVFELLAAELKSQYILGFEPDKQTKKDEWRKVKVKLKISKEKEGNNGKLFVRAQEGYFLKK